MAALSPDDEARLRALAVERGDDPDEVVAEVAAIDESAGGQAAPAGNGTSPGIKVHGGRGYFAYEFPFLTVNEVRESLFLGAAPDGQMFTGEWLAKHGGPAATAAAPPPDAPSDE